MIYNRIKTLVKLGEYLEQNVNEWKATVELAERQNAWFTQSFIHSTISQICESYLQENELVAFASFFHNTSQSELKPITVGIIMAGNIPLVGFHDLLCVYLSGFKIKIKLSSKDEILMRHVVNKMCEWDHNLKNRVEFSDMLKNCDAYIATGSSQSSSVFKSYFGKYPNIIRSNRTSIAILDGTESENELMLLADDVYLYFGLGCRNVTKLYVPQEYNFEKLLSAFRKYDSLKDHNKYRNNYDYNLALYILNSSFYMSNDSLLLVENNSHFSPIAVLHYSYYQQKPTISSLAQNHEIQAIIGHDSIPFGNAQRPSLAEFADGVNTVEFLNSLHNV